MKTRHTIIPAVFLVLRQGDQVLLQRRRNTGHGDGSLSLVGGHIDEYEPALSTLCREAKEEIGISIQRNDAKFVYVLHRKQDKEERVDFFFEVTKWKGEITISEPQKCAELVYCPMNQLPTDVLPYIKHALSDINLGIHYGEYAW